MNIPTCRLRHKVTEPVNFTKDGPDRHSRVETVLLHFHIRRLELYSTLHELCPPQQLDVRHDSQMPYGLAKHGQLFMSDATPVVQSSSEAIALPEPGSRVWRRMARVRQLPMRCLTQLRKRGRIYCANSLLRSFGEQSQF